MIKQKCFVLGVGLFVCLFAYRNRFFLASEVVCFLHN